MIFRDERVGAFSIRRSSLGLVHFQPIFDCDAGQIGSGHSGSQKGIGKVRSGRPKWMRSANRAAPSALRRRPAPTDEHPLESRIRAGWGIGDPVQRNAAAEAEVGRRGAPAQFSGNIDEDLLEDQLDAGSTVREPCPSSVARSIGL